ncbi:MAG: hypothetical protein GWM98_16490, partial [Nitrospinaceae bacterium]|nr:hypothetical protein [Nitrospinaceae bacterium]NIR55787.1 hypothetical protein [Nitrospinaceae bacterium]NIS86239.1 hypothetical protein [Nitrospinaceae bacterium]NIT83070.1 hypothetical protein [Nitrospinaceae bacterium]NIU45280.1 hypothetical protein [Nitrospinaceae bacterium]
YDAEKIENWYRQGVLSRKRREGVLGFIWDADLILHDVGGGTLHTKLKALDPLPDSIAERLVLVH